MCQADKQTDIITYDMHRVIKVLTYCDFLIRLVLLYVSDALLSEKLILELFRVAEMALRGHSG